MEREGTACLPIVFVNGEELTHGAYPRREELARADITPFAWVVNQSLTPLHVTDPVLRARRNHEAVHLRELATHGKRTVLEPWHVDILAADPVGVLGLAMDRATASLPTVRHDHQAITEAAERLRALPDALGALCMSSALSRAYRPGLMAAPPGVRRGQPDQRADRGAHLADDHADDDEGRLRLDPRRRPPAARLSSRCSSTGW